MGTHAIAVALALVGCDGASPFVDVDAGGPTPRAVLTPCPEGWREVTSVTGATTCEPWPDGGYRGAECAWDEAHFAGTPGCARVGSPCPLDGWPADLPSDRRIIYVDDGAGVFGDGASRESAYFSISQAAARSADGAIIAVATGRYDEVREVEVLRGMTIWGACAAETRIVTESPSGATLVFGEDGTGARNLGIDAPTGIGIVAIGVSGVSLEGIVIAGAQDFGLYLSGGSLAANDLVVRGTRERADGTAGRGINVEPGSTLALSHALIEDNRGIGFYAGGAGTSVEASDVVVRGTREQASDGMAGRGIEIGPGARVALSRALVEDNREVGMFISGTGTSVEASDIVVRGTRERAFDGTAGRGLDVEPGAQLVLSRALLEDNREGGLLVNGTGAVVEASDLIVRDTVSRAVDGALGAGVWAQRGGRLVVSGARVERSQMIGMASVAGASVEARGLWVNRVEPSRCLPGTCIGDSGGFGLVAMFGGTLAVTDFAVGGATLCGAVVGRDELAFGVTALDLQTGAIDRSAVGACVQVEGYDTSRLRNDVDYRDVGVPLEATSYELPDSLPSL